MSKLELKLMGAFSASIDGAPATSFESNKVRALLAYLAVESHRQHPREALAALLWPDWPDSAARSNLRYALADLRKVIGDRQAEPPFLLISRESLQFNPESDCWLDVGEIEAMVTDMRQEERVDIKRLEQAVALCQGEFLEGFSVADAAPFENWARLKREQLHRAYLHGLHQLAAALERSGEYERALVYARRHVIVEALDERAHRQVMRLLSFSGRDSEALAQYKTCQEVLDKELGAAPSAETSRLYELIRSGQLEAAAPAIPVVDGSQLPPDLAMKEVEKPVFVAREAELERLGAFLRNAVEGKGRVAFITGEAGSGKTALLQEFTRRSLAAHHQLLCSWGSCTACFGTGDPYQPFREIINILSGNYRLLASIFSVSQVHVQRLWNALPVVLQTLVARGPHLLPVLIDRNNLISNISHLDPGETNWLSELWKLLERVPNKPNGIERSQLYEQYTNTLLDLSNSYPLLLIIDDLQWADVSSLELLFHLARRLHHSRIMIVCAYRPEEIANARDGGINPLKKILAEFKAQLGDIWVDLNNIGKSERREFLDRFVDAEQNNLGSLFRQKLFERTRGHPLYTIEILRSMQDQGQLRKDTEGFWIEGENLIWEFIPIRVEGVIEERISHLDANLQEILSVASVQGLQFSTQIIAGVLEISEEHLSRRLGQELANRYRLVVEQGGFHLNGSPLTQFKFAHPLIQQYLYDRLGQQERVALHRRIAQMLEELYEGQLEEVSYQLVLHYAGEREKVMTYARIAGEHAAAQFAHQEALRYFGIALDLIPKEKYQDRFDVLLAREKIFDILGNREAQREDLSGLKKLANLMLDQEEEYALNLAEVNLRQARYATWCGDYPAAIAASQSALDLGEKLQDIIIQTSANLELGHALLRFDRNQESQIHLENGLKLARLAKDRRLEGLALYYLLNLNYADETSPDSSDLYFHQAITIFNELGCSYEMALTLNTYALFLLSKYDFNGAKKWLDELLRTSRQHGYRLGEAYGLTNLPHYYMSYGDYSTAKLYLEQGLLINEEINNRYLYWVALITLCVCHRYLGDFQASERYGKQALDIADEIGSFSCRVHSLNLYGHAQFVLGNWDVARQAYLDSLNLIAEVGFIGYKQEAKAGLIQLSFAQGDLDKALEEIELLYPDLENSNIIVFEGDWIYTLGYKVFKACGDSRADILLQKVYDLFFKISEKFEDEERGRAYLENVLAHREILQEWRVRQKT